MDTKEVTKILQNDFSQTVEDLKKLVRIPSVSFDGFDPKIVEASANAVADHMKSTGLENIKLIHLENTFPYVYGDFLHAPGKPTLLLYAHHDVQPPGREDRWLTKPFEPITKEGPGGERLYGRGTADDKAGILVHTAAIGAWLKATRSLPVNVKVLIEGEEEIGSPHLEEFLAKNKKELGADIMVLTDTANYDCGIPSLTTSLRGMVGLEIEVRALKSPIHSGLWGGLIPDPAMALTKMLHDLVDETGQIALKSIRDLAPVLSKEELDSYAQIPFDEKHFREQAGLVSSAQLTKYAPNAIAQLWRYPCLTINGIQSSSRAQPGNIINDWAWAKVTIRMSPGMNAQKVRDILESEIKRKLPWGLELTTSLESCSEGWMADSKGKHRAIFQAAHRALTAGYDRACVEIGCGATIPFVKPFAEALQGAPALLIGVEDPYTNAHGENESLLLSDFQKACVSQALLFEEIGKLK